MTEFQTSAIPQAIQHGLEHHRAGRLADAERIYWQILQADPANADALHLLGAIAHQVGKHEACVELLDKALAIDPGRGTVSSNRGLALHELGRYDEALASYDKALSLMPGYAEALYNRGITLQKIERYPEALDSYDRALAIRPDYPEALGNRGLVLQELMRYDEALDSYDRALSARPDFANALFNRGVVLQKAGRPDEAIASYDKVLSIDPGHAVALSNRGLALRELGRCAEALASCDRALSAKPEFAEAWSNRGLVLQSLGRHEEALASCDKALEIMPGFAVASSNRGMALQELGRYDEALGSYDRALALEPGLPDAHWNRALCLLVTGDFRRGWPEFEWRWETSAFKAQQRGFRQPLWRGRESLAGKTILLHAEQGLGDTLQLCRYAPMVAAMGATVLLEVQAPLKPLIAGFKYVDSLVARGEALPEFDLHCPLLSLPLAFGTTLESIPAEIPYLRADPDLVSEWRKRLGRKRGPRIGLAWSATSDTAYGLRRSMVLTEFANLIPKGAQCVSLQKDLTGAEREVIGARKDIVHFGMGFPDTAALVELMDVVVSVDTSIAHLAGAMGKKVWVLLPFAGDWRWLVAREDSPWYPSARLFRQAALGNWAGVVRQVGAELNKFAAK